MKKIITVVVAFILSSYSALAASDSIHWQAYSPSLFEQAKTSHHPVMLLAKSEACHWCAQMESNTFGNHKIIKIVNNSYTPAIIEINKNRDIFVQYKIVRLPSTLIFNENGKVIRVASGYIKADKMLQILKHAKT